jgi:hypothetical protein
MSKFHLEFSRSLLENAKRHAHLHGYAFDEKLKVYSKTNILISGALTYKGSTILLSTNSYEIYTFFLAWKDYPETQKTFTYRLEPECVHLLNTDSDFLKAVQNLYEMFKKFPKIKH